MTASQKAAQTPHFLPAKHLQQYRGVAGHWDEAVLADGTIRPHWQHFMQALSPQSPAEIQGRQDLCRRLLRESGVTYTPPDRELSEERPWQLDS